MSKEENGTELLDVNEDGKVETKKDEKAPVKANTSALVLMVIFLLIIAFLGGYYTYYQYNRMEEINSQKKQ